MFDYGLKKSIICVIDMDSFEVQLWQKLTNSCPGGPLKDHPPTVVADSSKRILAVNPEAKRFGIKRSKDRRVTVQEALQKCPKVNIINKPDNWGKPSTKEVRDASWNNLICVKKFLKKRNLLDKVILEYKSGDEMFLDLTQVVESFEELDHEYFDEVLERHPNLFYESALLCKDYSDFMHCEESRENNEWTGLPLVCPGLKPDRITDQAKLMYAGEIIMDLLNFVEKKTGLKASAGVSFNKTLAKFACNLHKPESCTILTEDGFERLQIAEETDRLDIEEVPGIGSGLRQRILDIFGKKYTDLCYLPCIPKDELVQALGKEIGLKVFQIGKGTYIDPVVPKQMTNQISCAKNNLRCRIMSDVFNAVQNLAAEMRIRVKEEKNRNRRLAKKLSMTIEHYNGYIRKIKMCFDDRKKSGRLARHIMNILTSEFILPKTIKRIALTVRDFHPLYPYSEEEFYKRFLIKNYNIMLAINLPKLMEISF